MVRRTRTTFLAIAAALCFGGATTIMVAAQPFPVGVCSGLLCSTIGGSTAPPVPIKPPSNCGGLFCGSIGEPFPVAGQAAAQVEAPPAPEPPPPVVEKRSKHRARHARTPAPQ